MPLISAARVIKCLATVPDGWPGYHCVKASRMARYLRRLSLIAYSFWIGCAFQREYTMGQPLNHLFQNDLDKVSGRERVDGIDDVWHAYPHSSRNPHNAGIARKLDRCLYKRLF